MSGDSLRLPEYLPQYGFGAETEFKQLVERNAFLFRVHTPKSPTRSDAVFPALKFDQRYTFDASSPSLDPPPPTYADVVRHMDWTTRNSSPYVSTSFSFMWAVWEAVRRYHFGVKHDIEIAVIDATALTTHAVTAVEVMRSIPSAGRHEHHWKWYQFAQESQLVLVYGCIPQAAILTSVPLLRIIDELPSYCRRPPSALPPRTEMERLCPSFLLQKPSFRNFCVAQSATFSCASANVRFRDSTAAAVQLALAFLGVWFHWMLQLHPPRGNDHTVFSDAAVTKVTELARMIAVWPAASQTTKMWEAVIREITLLVAEEVKTCRRPDAETTSHLSPAVSDTPVPNSDTKVHCPDNSLPIFMDPRNFLPTPPPTPPPTLRSRYPASADSTLRVPVSALPPHDTSTENSEEKSTVPDAANGNSSPESPPFAPAVDGIVAETVSSPAPAEAVAPSPPLARTPSAEHSAGETASCLLTGFLFGALIIIALSQRRPGLLYAS
ncbi:hypothetical protein K438DRAFT_1994468 [Mycena galopus ATCC 62051]|nr:hypothetical protein K438DRAFT_1994468 [Mycena galopus ATCC 62051]